MRVTRSRRNVAWTGLGALVVVALLFGVPCYIGPGTTGIMMQARIAATLASMWNLLAGYAGLVSVGQQAFFGLGAYFMLISAMHGVTPWFGLVIATTAVGVCAFPLWWLVSRLRTGYFAIATWVLAIAIAIVIVIEQIQSIGGGTGEPLPGLTGMDPAVLTVYTYRAALIVAVLAIGGGGARRRLVPDGGRGLSARSLPRHPGRLRPRRHAGTRVRRDDHEDFCVDVRNSCYAHEKSSST